LRERLAAALEAQHIAETALADAEAAHARAQRHVERAGCDLDRYADLDAAMTEATVSMLRNDDGELRERDDLMGRMVERERSRVAYAAAGSAVDLLGKELAIARGKAAEAAVAADRLIVAILGFAAAGLAASHAGLLAEAAKIAEVLHAYNHFSANRSTSMPASVRHVLGNDTATLARQRDKRMWIAAARLRNDPQAQVSIGAVENIHYRKRPT
jgi:hypothetical protein